jgi:hypothetical protein
MYKDQFDKLVEKGIISESESSEVYTQMHPNSDGQLVGMSDNKIDYKYYIQGDIFNENLCNFVIHHCTPLLGMENIDNTFKKYGMTYSGISDGWSWFTKDNITQYAIDRGYEPIENATDEELWKMLAMSSMYWEGKYEEWYNRAEKKSNILDYFIGQCERKYFGYDKEGYTLNTIRRIFDKIDTILKDKFGK